MKSFKHEINKMKFICEALRSESWMESGLLAGGKSKRTVGLEVICK